MTMSSATLSTQLQAITGATEAAAISAWSLCWANYFAGAVAGSGPGVAFTSNPGTIAAARAAMEAVMAGLSSSGGESKVQAGIVAWWDYLVAHPAACFAGAASVTKPGGLTGIAAQLGADFTTNKNAASSASVACGLIAGHIHTANSGGSADIGAIT